jgi:hypothetical protein
VVTTVSQVRARPFTGGLFVLIGTAALVGCGTPSASGQPAPTYIPVPGSPDVPLNSSHQGAQGSTFPSQRCNDANPDPPGPGEVGWHFILPQSVAEIERALSPGNIFESITVTFATAGTVTLTAFGPPSDAHAYFTTPTDDVLLSGNADILREVSLLRGNESSFNLSHTCAPPVDTTTTTSTTTEPSSTTTDPAAPTTAAPTTTVGSTTTMRPSTSISGGGGSNTTTTTATGAASGLATTTVLRQIPVTGNADGRLASAALIILSLGLVLAVIARRPTST